MILDLEDLATAAQENGWATGTGTIDDVRESAKALGWGEVPMRRGENPVKPLHPATPAQAAPRSLSALYGLAAQPLHTDGAHLDHPPPLVVLAAPAPNRTPTLLWRPPWSAVSQWQETLRHGLFVVNTGRRTFLATAAEGDGIRFDPGCMRPCDQRARALTQHAKEAATGAAEQVWSRPDMVLVIDNQRTLHARAAVGPDDRDRLLHRLALTPGSSR